MVWHDQVWRQVSSMASRGSPAAQPGHGDLLGMQGDACPPPPCSHEVLGGGAAADGGDPAPQRVPAAGVGPGPPPVPAADVRCAVCGGGRVGFPCFFCLFLVMEGRETEPLWRFISHRTKSSQER